MPGRSVTIARALIGVLATALGVLLALGFLCPELFGTVSMRGAERKLKRALAGATRLRVRSGGTCHRRVESEQTLYEERDSGAIQQLVANIALDEEKSGFHCECCGDPTFEFYKGKYLVASLGFHHGQSLRWPDGWRGDGALTPVSAAFLVKWLADHNVTGPQDTIARDKERAAASERKFERAARGLPESVRTALRTGSAPFRKALKKEMPEPEKQMAALLRIFGASNGSWTELEWLEQRAEEALKADYKREDLGAAVRWALLSGDRQLRRGAARLWCSWRSPLEDWKPDDVAPLHSVVLTVQQDARYYPLRQDALRHLKVWAKELPAEEVARRFRIGLRDPHASVRRQAMIAAGSYGYTPAAEHLMMVVRGEPIELLDLPRVPDDEAADVPEGSDDVAAKRSESEVAALALGYLKHAPAVALLEHGAGDSPMYAVALALAGQPQRLKEEHFQSGDRNQELQLAAVEAVVRCQGRHGLLYALYYKQATHWWEEAFVARTLAAMLREAQAPGGESLGRQNVSLKDVRDWFAQHGDGYLARFTEKK